MARGVVLLSTVTLLLQWTVDGSLVKDNTSVVEDKNPIKHSFSEKALAELKEKCKQFREQIKLCDSLEERKDCKEQEQTCLELDNIMKLNLETNGESIAALDRVDKVETLENPENSPMMAGKASIPATNRQKRATSDWTCSHIRSAPMMFLTATADEISAMQDEEFIDCIPDIGKLTELNSVQRDACLSKAKTALSKSNVCDMETTDLVNLGVVALAFVESDCSCLPLNNDLVTSLGSLEKWTAGELSALATRYMSVNSLSDLSTLTSEDITMLGSILCGFTANQLATLPAVEIGKSGAHIGELHECAVVKLAQLVSLATHADAYGPVNTLDAAEVEELGYLIAGLTGTQIKELTVEAIEGLNADVIPVIPADVLKEMTSDQMKSFTDAQAVSVTDSQKAVMSDEQKKLLGEQATGGEEALEEVAINGDNDSSKGSFTQMSSALFGLIFFLFFLT